MTQLAASAIGKPPQARRELTRRLREPGKRISQRAYDIFLDAFPAQLESLDCERQRLRINQCRQGGHPGLCGQLRVRVQGGAQLGDVRPDLVHDVPPVRQCVPLVATLRSTPVNVRRAGRRHPLTGRKDLRLTTNPASRDSSRLSDWGAAAEHLGSSGFAGLHEARGIRSVSLRLLDRPAILEAP
jgi:hypothetical protein